MTPPTNQSAELKFVAHYSCDSDSTVPICKNCGLGLAAHVEQKFCPLNTRPAEQSGELPNQLLDVHAICDQRDEAVTRASNMAERLANQSTLLDKLAEALRLLIDDPANYAESKSVLDQYDAAKKK